MRVASQIKGATMFGVLKHEKQQKGQYYHGTIFFLLTTFSPNLQDPPCSSSNCHRQRNIGNTRTWNKITLESCYHIAEQQFIVPLPWIVLGLYFTQRSLTYQCPDLGICATLLKLMWSAHTKQTIAKEHKQHQWCHGTH